MTLRVIKYILCILTLASFSGCGKHAYYKVKTGDTLYSIGWQYQTDFRIIAQWNGISVPYVIRKGDWIRVVPPPDRSGFPDNSRYRTRKHSNIAIVKSEHSTAIEPEKSQIEDLSDRPYSSNKKSQWQWPTSGTLLYAFQQSSTTKKGLGIQGSLGQAIYAASNGKVVYSGKGLVGYGNLVIIKHNDYFLSAYGHNRINLVKEGQFVKKGQKIALLGRSGTDRPLLHFEIRKNGTAVNPLIWLPKKNETI